MAGRFGVDPSALLSDIETFIVHGHLPFRVDLVANSLV
ncbi:hypothetical protein KIPB_016989, partial [Kipferlia bialata]|eukprot:g16989.t1